MKTSIFRTFYCIGFFAVFSALCLRAHAGETAQHKISLSVIPAELTVLNEPKALRVEADGSLFLAAAGHTNLFNNPSDTKVIENAPMVLFEVPDGFVLMARVTGSLKNVYDVAALVIYQDGQTWAKLCYENSVAKESTIVSVVTRTFSDDCNSQSIDTDHAFLAIARKGSAFSFNYSPDGKTWRMIRHFNLATTGNIKAGFTVHSYSGEGFSATFSEIRYVPKAPESLRRLPAISQ
jgi:regulation of enolase protein 1 (concanavalin A-like superfamily)